MQHRQLLYHLVEQLKPVAGLRAIVLGGSYARGDQRQDSDLDLGLYYSEDQPLDIARVRTIAAALNDTPEPTVADLGGWGPWVNGGAWLTIGGQRVDFLYRDLTFVHATIDECQAGRIRSDYWQQPAYGFHSFMYCAETAICQPLYDPENLIAQIKERVAVYPPRLKQAILGHFLWQARFTLDNIRKPAARGEIYLTAGGLARVIHCLVQVLYALNETYYLSEKQLARELTTFAYQPAHFLERIYHILSAPGATSAELLDALERTEALYRECADLQESHGLGSTVE